MQDNINKRRKECENAKCKNARIQKLNKARMTK